MTRRQDIASRVAVAAVALAAVALVVYKVVAQIAVGPSWDSFAFLANAAQFAGRGFGYSEPARAPLMSLITAVPLALGAFDARTIQVVDGVLTLATLLGFYLLVRRRFSRVAAACASLGLLMAPPVWQWVGVGYTDLAAMGLAVWALYFAVRASEDDQRFYLLALPFALAVVLMRLNAALFFVPFAVWLGLRARPFRDAKALVGGLFVALLAFVPIAVFYLRTTGNALYPFVAGLRVQEAGNVASTAVRDVQSYVGSLHSLAAPSTLSAFTLVALALAGLGLIDAAWRSVRARRPGARRVIAALIVAAGMWFVGRHGFVASQAAVGVGVFAIWRLAASTRIESNAGVRHEVPAEYALDAAMIAWLLCFLWFHETWAQRVTRYYITMAPGVVYLVVLGWRQLIRDIGVVLPAEKSARPGIPGNAALRGMAWAPLALLLVAGLALDVASTSWRPDPSLPGAQQSAAWLAKQPDIAGATVYSDLWPMTAWYMQRRVKPMPFIDAAEGVEHELDANNAAYYVTTRSRPLPRYAVRYTGAGVQVLAARSAPPAMPDILYLGGGWDHYIEQLGGYKFALKHDAGDNDLLGTAFLDAYSPSELARYKTITAFGFLWHDRGTAERRMQQWVSDGGTLVIDASRNLVQPTSLGDSVLFDTVIRRDALPRTARITVDPAFLAEHPELAAEDDATFVTDTGQAWYGASYDALPGSAPLRVLARVDGRPLVVERVWGRGRVIWIGYNFAWHAFQSGRPSEARLVSASLQEAIAARSVIASGQ